MQRVPQLSGDGLMQLETHLKALPVLAHRPFVPVHFAVQLPHDSGRARLVSQPSSGFAVLQLP